MWRTAVHTVWRTGAHTVGSGRGLGTRLLPSYSLSSCRGQMETHYQETKGLGMRLPPSLLLHTGGAQESAGRPPEQAAEYPGELSSSSHCPRTWKTVKLLNFSLFFPQHIEGFYNKPEYTINSTACRGETITVLEILLLLFLLLLLLMLLLCDLQTWMLHSRLLA